MKRIIDDEIRTAMQREKVRKELLKHSHYKKDVSHLKMIDVYRVLQLFNVTDPCEQHAVKKILCAGIRGGKSTEQDIREARDSLNRRLEMIGEDCNGM